MPVSYTHLDVYKRQAWSRLFLKFNCGICLLIIFVEWNLFLQLIFFCNLISLYIFINFCQYNLIIFLFFMYISQFITAILIFSNYFSVFFHNFCYIIIKNCKLVQRNKISYLCRKFLASCHSRYKKMYIAEVKI